jgi:hypothetical protein
VSLEEEFFVIELACQFETSAQGGPLAKLNQALFIRLRSILVPRHVPSLGHTDFALPDIALGHEKRDPLLQPQSCKEHKYIVIAVRLAQSRWVARTRPVVDLRPFVKSHRLNRSEPTPPNASIRARKIVRRIRSRGIPRCLWAPNDSDRYRSWTHPLTLLTLTPSAVRGNSDSVEQTTREEVWL